ncbi:Exocyst complex component 3 [Phytophthora boehmeriae]|uniref:Exocyst complex component 3 n=1 Tax=Phytophthora boehmeriae TaxID=109152 RepID=A0A8T1X7S4_9STRA|nr:Exocyst complex component 3 [Phytophthora boehmeriae]
MISLLEKQARDPVEVLRVKLKDSTSTSLLNSQLLQEIKNDYLAKQDSTKGQLAGFVQAQVDEIERASALLELEEPVQQIVSNLNDLGQSCRRMNEELGEKKVSSSGVSIARRNLKELELQMVFYEELPKKTQALHDALDGHVMGVVDVYKKWQEIDDWRQKILHELNVAAVEKSDELGNSKAQARIMASMASRLSAIESVQNRIYAEVWGCLHHCVEIAQFGKQRLLDAFQVLNLMEVRRQRFADSKKEVYLDNQLKPVAEFNIPCRERCKTEISTFLSRRIENLFHAAEAEAERKKQDLFTSILEVANQIMIDMEIVQSDVASCFPSEIDVIHLFTSTYNTLLENQITQLSSRRDIGIAQRLQLVQWIDYYNTEIIKYKHSRASVILDQTSRELMKSYLDEIKVQIHTWVTNIWKRDEECVIGPQGELQSTRPNDIVNILKSQISIAQEYLSGRLVGCVVAACLQVLMEELKIRYDSIAGRLESVDADMLCTFINDAEILQAKCPELVEEISFAETDSEEKEAFDTFMGDSLDTTSTDIVAFATKACDLIVNKIFHEVEEATTRKWFSKKWDEGTDVVGTLLATLDDYYPDLKKWIFGSFFFSKIVRQCLNQCVKEYGARLLSRTHSFANPAEAATIVDNDLHNFVQFFNKYSVDLRRTGIRSEEDIKREFITLQVISSTLRGEAPPDCNQNEIGEILRQVIKLIKSSSTQEAKSETKSKEKLVKEGSVKKKRFGAISKSKKNKKTDKADAAKSASSESTKESTSRGSSFTQHDEDGDSFTVQKLDMAAFLGS